MSVTAYKADDSHAIYTFAKALQQLSGRGGQLTPPLESFLRSNASKLAACAEPFKIPNPASRAKVDTGKVTADSGDTVTLGEREKEIVKTAADKLLIDEVEAAILFKRYRRSKAENVSIDVEAGLSRSDEFWQDITSFVLDEQLRVIQLVALLLRTADFEDRIPAEVVHQFTARVTTPAFAESLLSRVSHLATTPIPTSAIPFSPLWAKYWVQQQKALLEVYFLLYYNRLFPDGKALLSVLQFVKTTVWGSLQVNEGLFDAEAQALTRDVAALSHLVLIESMNLERAATPEAEEFNLTPGDLPVREALLHFQTLHDTHQRILELISLHPRQSALLALAWAFVLYRITESISSVPLPETYYDIAQQILPVDLQPRKERLAPQANASDQPLWQQLVTHALSPHIACLGILHDVLSTSLVSPIDYITAPTAASTDPNVAGYLSVVRSLLASLSRLVHPSYLPAQDFERLIEAFEVMYTNSEAGLLRGNFWGLFADSENNPMQDEEWQVFDVAAKRFPAEVTPLTRLLLAVSGGRLSDLLEMINIHNPTVEEGRSIEGGCADRVVRYLAQPQTLTQRIPSVSALMPLPYEPSRASHASPSDVVATRQIKISTSISIHPGTQGRIVSPPDQRPPIVSWKIATTASNASISAFRFYGDYLRAFATRLTGKRMDTRASSQSIDIFDNPGTQDVPRDSYKTIDEQIPEATYIVALLRNVLQHLPAKHSNILQATFDDVRSGLRILFTLLECTAETEKASGLFIVTANVFALLLVTQPEDVWSLLRSSDVAFPLDQTTLVPVWGTKASPGRKNILLQDKILGRYGRTLACLELVQGLVKQAQWSVGTDQAPVREVKSSVLRRAMGWTLTCILPSYNSWKFADLRQKYEMGTRLASIIRDVLQETYSDPQGSLAGPFSIISQNLLFYPGHAQLSSIMDTISTGNETLSALQRLGKPADCHAIETCIHGHLQVVNRLLQISRISDTPGPILLERLLFAHESDSLFRSILPEARQDPIYMLIEYLVTCDVADIANEAAGILTKLCRLSIEWGRPSERPSLLSHLGSLRDTEAILRRFVELAGDPYGDLDLQLSTWRLLRAIAASQPGFSALLVTGHQTLEPETDSGPTAPEQDRAALGLALEVVYGWEEAWAVQPAILSAAITFLLELWQNYADSSKTLHAVRQEEKLWSALINIWNMSLPSSQSQAGSGEDSESSEVKQAHRRYAQAGVAALYAVELQITQTPPIHAPSGGLSISIKVFLNLVKNSTQLTAICQNAVGTSHADTEIRQIKDRLAPILLDVKLDSYVQPRLVDPAPYGPYFYYDSMVLAKRLIGSIGDLHSSSSKAVVALESIHQANIHWSRIDAESALLKATSTCLRVGLASMRLEEQSALSLQTACKTLLNSREAESSETAILEARYSGRLHLVLAMLEQLSRKHVECSKEFSSDLIRQLGVIVGNDAFPIDAFHTQSASGYASAIFKLIYHAFCMSSIHDASLSKKSIEPKCYESTEICLFACIKACNILIISAEDRNAGDAVAQNLSSVTSAISEILSSEMCPISISWLAYCDEVDFFRHCLDYITATDLCGNGLSIAHSILDLLLAMANDSRAAEKLALQGIVYSLCNNTLTEDLETGRLQDELPRSQDQSPGYSRHGIWILYLSLVNQLVCHLGKSQTFMEEEVTTFLQMYGKQVRRVLSWNATATIQLSEMHELRAVLSLLASLIKSSSEAGHLVPQSQDMLRSSLRTLPSFVYLLQHPNVLLSLVEATNPDQSLWLASEAVSSDAIDLGDLHNHLVVASLCQEVFSLCWLSVSTFVTYTSCFRILTRDRVDWPRDRAVIIASANVSLDEATTYGTLFDLARFCIDITRHCTSAPIESRSDIPLPAYNVTMMREIAEQCLEGTLLLLSTQIALMVQQQDVAGSDGRAGQRARRDLKELASDLMEEFLDKASPSQPMQERKLPEILKAFVLRL